ncbi:MAG: toxin-antitoxin system, antitoxin component, Xre family protein [Blastocatellia bacterium]
MNKETIINKLDALPINQLKEVEDFIDFLCYKNQQLSLTQEAMKLSEASFRRVWDNEEDSVYDQLQFR